VAPWPGNRAGIPASYLILIAGAGVPASRPRTWSSSPAPACRHPGLVPDPHRRRRRVGIPASYLINAGAGVPELGLTPDSGRKCRRVAM